jgi:hypothetical protein
MKSTGRFACARFVLMVGLVTLVAATGCDSPIVDSGQSASWSIAQPWSGPAPRSPSLFPAREDGKWGFIDNTGQLAIDFQYEQALDFSDGMAAVKVGGSWGYIDESGTMAIAPQFPTGFSFYDGLAQVGVGHTMGFMNHHGDVVIEPATSWLDAYHFSEGLAGVRFFDESFGYIDTSGEVVIRLPNASDVGYFSEGLAAVKEGLYGFIDRSGHFVIEPRFLYAEEFSNGMAVVEAQSGYQIIDTRGSVMATLEFQTVKGLREERAAVSQGGLFAALDAGAEDPYAADYGWGYIDETGDVVVPADLRMCWDYRGGLARIEDKNGKMAYIGLDGTYVWREE